MLGIQDSASAATGLHIAALRNAASYVITFEQVHDLAGFFGVTRRYLVDISAPDIDAEIQLLESPATSSTATGRVPAANRDGRNEVGHGAGECRPSGNFRSCFRGRKKNSDRHDPTTRKVSAAPSRPR